MIRKAADCKKEYRENMRGGNGTVEITNFATPDELNNKGRLFANITLNPGCGIGFHTHENESELFYLNYIVLQAIQVYIFAHLQIIIFTASHIQLLLIHYILN